ncbi:MAG: CvpA family protein [Clostridia bacterium]|nr:CvpA family protein [Clostridia bacterium]
MDSATISLIIAVAFLACLVIGFLRGFFKGVIKSAIDTFLGVLSAALSFPITRIIMGALVNSKLLSFVADRVMSAIPAEAATYVETLKGYMESPESGTLVKEALTLITALLTIFIAPLIFIVVFALLALVLFGMGFFIKMFISSKKQKIGWRIVGGVLGAFTYVLVVTAFIIPVNGYVNIVNDASQRVLEVVESNELPSNEATTKNDEDTVPLAEKTGDGIESGDMKEPADGENGGEVEIVKENEPIDLSELKPILNLVIDYTSVSKENPVLSTISSFGGKKIFNSLTTVETAGSEICLEKELNGLIDLGDVVLKFANTPPEEYGETQALAIERADEILSSSDYLPELVSRAISFAAGEFYEGKDLFGLEKPNLGEEFNPMLDNVLRILQSTDANDLRNDIGTISRIASSILESGLVEKVSSGQFNVTDIVEEREVFETAFVELYTNSRTRNLLPYVTSYITDYIYALYDDINDTTTNVPSFDYDHYTIERMYLEAVYLTDAIDELNVFFETIDVSDEELDPKQIIMDGNFAALGRGLEDMRDSIFTDRIFKIVVYAVLHSELAEKLAIVDARLIESINDTNTDLESMLVSRQNIMKLALSIQELENREQTNMLIDSVIESLISEDTSTLTAIVSKENLEIMGMNSQQAASIEAIVGSMVHGASGFEFESNEEKQEEIKKTEEIIFAIGNTVLDEDREHHHMFEQGDGIGSTTEMTAQDFVDNIVDSKLTSSMIQSATTDQSGEAIENPYNLQGVISEDDMTEIENALNNSYKQENVTEDERKTLEALASIFGVKLN